MSTYTPGPWEVDQMGVQHAMGGERIFKVCKSGKYGGLIADVSAWWVDTLSAEANAHLIAACPELLLACQSALRVFHLDSDMEEDFADEISQLERAIAKAEGRG